ncbi:hypothetical protein SNE35_20685 [Paucibacter sp. R3-3]|uniref:Uncharacterized protein n=2 Tax=Roseateles agri TaxID=3098619 RepID=A0ABU5DKX9_9BURK|nr:hypothetical protein [Paucibacter sp. R3-3]
MLQRSSPRSARWLAAAALAAAGLMHGPAQAACLSAWADDSVEFTAPPTSLLVGRADLPFRVGRLRHGDAEAVILAHETADHRLLPMATAAEIGDAARPRICVDLLGMRDAGTDRALVITAVERFYGLVLRLDGEGDYCLADASNDCPVGQRLSQGDVLRELVRVRAEALDDKAKPWSVVSLAPAKAASSDLDDVAAQVSGDAGPMAGATVFFHRAPHSGCVAKSGEQGVATCRLVDQHGDEDPDEHEADAKLLVTFPGEIGTDRTLVPMTQRMQRAR